MPILTNVIEVELWMKEKPTSTNKKQEDYGCFVKHTWGRRWYDVESVHFFTPAKAVATKEYTRFIPESPVACWINPYAGEEMVCDTMDNMKKNQWEERERRAIKEQIDQDLTGQDEESFKDWG